MITKEEQKQLMRFCRVKIKQNPLTKKFYWAQYDGYSTKYYASDGEEYQTRTQAQKAFIEFAIVPIQLKINNHEKLHTKK